MSLQDYRAHFDHYTGGDDQKSTGDRLACQKQFRF